MIAPNPTPSPQLLKEVRAALTLQGSSLSAYCEQKGLTRQNVSAALSGKWTGPRAQALVQHVVADARKDAA